MLWLGIHLPLLPLEVFERGIDPQACASPPLLICNRLQVLHANQAAQALGVSAGIKRATALALAPQARIAERDAPREQQALAQLACWALQFTPSVTVPASESGLLLEIEPSLRLFNGLDALRAQVLQGLDALGFQASIAHAPTATAAWLLARHRHGSGITDLTGLASGLAGLPVSLLAQARSHGPALEAIGIQTLAQLQQLPRAGLARRFGKPLLQELDQAMGQLPDPRVWFQAPAQFHVRLELLAQIEQAQALLFAARRLLLQLAGWLGASCLATSQVDLLAEHDDLPPTRIALHTAEPTRDADRLTILLREKLGVTTLPAPVHTLVLDCRDTSSLATPNDELFPVAASAREGLGRLMSDCKAGSGANRYNGSSIAADHRPEAAYRIEQIGQIGQIGRLNPPGPVPTDNPAAATHPAGIAAAGALPRPLWLLRAPVALSERNHKPYWHSPLALLAGPERIESGWWDGRLVQRDYFIAEDELHALYWIFRERLPDADSRQGWFMQGRFG